MIALLDNTPLHLVRLSVGQYQKMLDHGILEEAAPIEFLDGLLVYKDLGDGRDLQIIDLPHVFVQVGNTEKALVCLNVDQYHAMLRLGVLEEGVPIELLDGLLIWKDRRDRSGDIMTVGPRHVFVGRRLTKLLESLEWSRPVQVRFQSPITLPTLHEPEPDVCIAVGEEVSYFDHHPSAEEIGLVVEVADSSLHGDRTQKLAAYAEAGIASYWIVNLLKLTVEIYGSPDPSMQQYEQCEIHELDGLVETEVLGQQIRVPVRDIFGPVASDTEN